MSRIPFFHAGPFVPRVPVTRASESKQLCLLLITLSCDLVKAVPADYT